MWCYLTLPCMVQRRLVYLIGHVLSSTLQLLPHRRVVARLGLFYTAVYFPSECNLYVFKCRITWLLVPLHWNYLCVAPRQLVALAALLGAIAIKRKPFGFVDFLEVSLGGISGLSSTILLMSFCGTSIIPFELSVHSFWRNIAWFIMRTIFGISSLFSRGILGCMDYLIIIFHCCNITPFTFVWCKISNRDNTLPSIWKPDKGIFWIYIPWHAEGSTPPPPPTTRKLYDPNKRQLSVRFTN